MISILAQVENLPIKPFEISEIEGLKGWVITLAFLTLVMIMKEVFKLFSDRKRSKEMELLMNLTVEQKAFNEKIENHFQTIANKYSKNSSDHYSKRYDWCCDWTRWKNNSGYSGNSDGA